MLGKYINVLQLCGCAARGGARLATVDACGNACMQAGAAQLSCSPPQPGVRNTRSCMLMANPPSPCSQCRHGMPRTQITGSVLGSAITPHRSPLNPHPVINHLPEPPTF